MPTYARGCKPSTKIQLAKSFYAGRRLIDLPAPPANLYNGVTDWTMGGNGPATPSDESYRGQPLGDCVPCMIANGKRVVSASTGAAEVRINAAQIVNWYLSQTGGQDAGMNIGDAMTALQTSPMAGHAGGPNGTIDYTNKTELQLAIQEFKFVALGVAADQLQNAVPQDGSSGWTLTNARHDPNLDHCIFVLGYGTLPYLFGQLRMTPPPGANASIMYWAVYTWATVGFLDTTSLLAITGEAHVFITDPDRGDSATWNPVAAQDYAIVTGAVPQPPTPVPTPTPPPSPTPVPPGPVPSGLTILEYRADILDEIDTVWGADVRSENPIERWTGSHFKSLAHEAVLNTPTS